MVVSVSKRKSRSSKKTDDPPIFFFFCYKICSTFFRSFLYLTLVTIIFFFLIYLWLSFTTLISDNILHICVFSRKVNDPYCLTAGSKPVFQVPINLTTKSAVLGKDEEIGSVTNETFAGAIPRDRASGDQNKSQDENFDVNNKDGEMGSRRSSTFPIETSRDKVEKAHDVLDQERTPKNLDSALGNKDGELGSPINVTFVGESAGARVSDDPTKNRSEDKKVYDVFEQERQPKNLDSVLGNKDGEMGLQTNDTLAGVIRAGDSRVHDDPTKLLRSEYIKEYDAFVQEDKPNNLDSVLDQETKPKNKVDLNSLIDQKAEEEYSKYIKPKSEGQGYALRAVIKYLYLQRSWLSPGNNSVNKLRSCEGKGVYVYDLPSKFNKDLLVECNDILPGVDLCSYFKNDGFGEAIDNLGKGWFGTHMYSLEPILHSRVLKHPCRVYNETQARLFYVPYYGGFDVLRWHYRNVSDDVKDQLGIDVLKWLEPKESWKRNAGKDHVFVLGKIASYFRRDKVLWGSRFLELQEMQNPTKLLIGRQPWQVNDIAIPPPTYFHPQTDEDIARWQIKIMNKPRPSLVSFAGAARPDNPNNFQSTLIEQCISSDQCRFLDCTNGSCKDPKNVINLFQDSEFCLQPPGDSETRRSVFDSLISGCIPVIFSPFTAYYQYAWHLSEDHRRYSVYISEDDVKEKRVNVVEKLNALTVKEKDDMRNCIIHQLLPGLVYGDPNAKFEKFRDAFDITFDSLFEKIKKSE